MGDVDEMKGFEKMKPRENEYLKPCPFCGNESVLKIVDEPIQNNVMTAEICCGHCHYTSKTTLRFEHSGAVSGKAHNKIIDKIAAIWNNWAEEASTKQLLTICNTLLELSCVLERGHVVARHLVSEYFADHMKEHEKNQGLWLLHYYDYARIFAEIADDYYEQALQMTDRLMDNIDAKDIG